MVSERGAMITLCGEQHEMILTTRATKEINRRYGGLGKLGDKLSGASNFEEVIDELVWLITLLVNQSILIHNAKNKFSPENIKPLFTEDDIELFGFASEEEFLTYGGYPVGQLEAGYCVGMNYLQIIRRIVPTPDFDPTRLTLGSDTRLVQDFRGNYLLIFPGTWAINWALDKNPGLTLTAFDEMP